MTKITEEYLSQSKFADHRNVIHDYRLKMLGKAIVTFQFIATKLVEALAGIDALTTQ